METEDGSDVFLRGDCTPLDNIVTTNGRVITQGDLHKMHIRDIFPQPVTTRAYFTALGQMKALSDIEFMHGEQQGGFKLLEIYHPLKHRLRTGGVGSA